PQTGRVPELHRAVGACRSQVLALAAENQPPDLPVVMAERADRVAGLSVPNVHDESILARRDQVAAVGAERDGERLRAARQREGYSTCPGVPDLDDKVIPLVIRTGGGDTGGGDPLAVGVPGHTEDDTRAARKLEVYSAGPHVPNLH